MLLHRILGRSAKPNPTNWNPNEHQGKRKEQVDYSDSIIFVCCIALIVIAIIVGIAHLV
jgi:uncharacterized membrane protein YidH (DUF202 family)